MKSVAKNLFTLVALASLSLPLSALAGPYAGTYGGPDYRRGGQAYSSLARPYHEGYRKAALVKNTLQRIDALRYVVKSSAREHRLDRYETRRALRELEFIEERLTLALEHGYIDREHIYYANQRLDRLKDKIVWRARS
jgi:hypothetical protein